jgi:transposase-like protein
MSDVKTFSGDQKIKLTQLINEGMAVMHEIDTLQGGLTDTVKAIAEELEVKPSVLKKAIRIAHKASLTQSWKLWEKHFELCRCHPFEG